MGNLGNPDPVPKATCPSSPELSRLGSLGTIGEGKRLGKRATMRKLPLFSFLSSSGGCQSLRTGPLDREDHHRLIEIATGSMRKLCRSAHYTAGRQNIPAEPATHSNRGQNKAWQHNSRHCRPANYIAGGSKHQPVASSHCRWWVGMVYKPHPASQRQNTSVWCQTKHKTVEFGDPEAGRASQDLREPQTNTNMDNHRVFKR
ncbi:hypothetical protein HYC85_028347 [Camellia sinensis]|uniref:Uncharacterized protein n=1 Tax=Camellia sinensis TaxID=4442 RepID=A0A7J7FYX2_CAMSI|nr:hypothetical protein HYC85_028347 [Camellia sinensis]